MLSNHYPLAFASEMNWLIAALVFLMGVTIRHYFNSVHARQGNPTWTWLATALLFIAIIWLSTAPMFRADEPQQASGAALRFAQADGFGRVQDIVTGRCSMCHAADPGWEGLLWAPKGIRLETEYQIASAAKQIYLQAGITNAMPPANLSHMEPTERAEIVAWFNAANK